MDKQTRQELKKRGKRTLKSHYILLLMLCMVASYIGVEFTTADSATGLKTPTATGLVEQEAVTDIEQGAGQRASANADASAGQRANATAATSPNAAAAADVSGIETTIPSDEEGIYDVFSDIVSGNENEGAKTASSLLQQYAEGKDQTRILGRRNGALATVANSITSGHFLVRIFQAINTMTESKQASTVIFVLLSIIFYMIIWIFVRNVYKGIMRRMFLEARIYEKVPLGELLFFKTQKRWTRASLTLALTYVYETLWWFTIVGGFIKIFSYAMVPFIVAENPDIKPKEAITLSRRMMDGHKWELFKFELSFIGWYLFAAVTAGLSDLFWGAPYRTAAEAEYYVRLRSLAKEEGIEGAERLNDTYLFEKAPEDLLRKTYADIHQTAEYVEHHEAEVQLHGIRKFFTENLSVWLGSTESRNKYTRVQEARNLVAREQETIDGRSYPDRLNERWMPKFASRTMNTSYLKTYTIWVLVAMFFIFSMGGWLWEVSIHLVEDGVFVNRGTMHGPWLPIYGYGGVMILMLLTRFRRRPVVEAIMAIILCGIVEYSTSYYLEMTQGRRWWDYSGYFFNLNGRICAEGLMVFAIGGMAIVYLLAPHLDNVLAKVRPKVLIPITLSLLILFGIDSVYSHYHPNEGKGITDYTEYQEES